MPRACSRESSPVRGWLRDVPDPSLAPRGSNSRSTLCSDDELRRLDAAKSEFVSLASHRLRAPLTAIQARALFPTMKAQGNRVTVPRSRPRRVDDGVPVDVDGERSAHLGAGGEDLGERISDPLESGLAAP